MPGLVPTTPDDPAAAANRAAWQRLSTWDKPFLVAFSDRDPVTGGMAPILSRIVPGARSVTIPGGGHFLQEDAGPLLGDEIARFVLDSSKPLSSVGSCRYGRCVGIFLTVRRGRARAVAARVGLAPAR